MATRSKQSERLASLANESQEPSASSTPTNFLFRFFTKICLELGLDGPLSIDRAFENFLRDPRNGMRQDRPGIATDKNNLIKQLFPADRNHSWKVFNKGLRVIGVIGIKFTLELEHSNKQKTIHHASMKLPDYNPETEDNSEPDDLTKSINSLHKKVD